ncbi:carbon-nitrogen hydrolase family protein (plasmid) [Devosia neptuniae]|uniref:Carbon-nitrogen hydrolase family protein n=1 Tax=Devosia neptuniae TaxID=191302 RepID=A0ABY6C6N0_9HYPH|nr:carbon-nitrogen hydrolase family protein [Devosia neptuniae]UXN67910.1 carbon-nitrogen hydrolase family protein [Devosia neptuniae]
MKLAMIQMNSQPDRSHNLRQATELMHRAVAAERPDLIVLPEHFDWSGGTIEQKLLAADNLPNGEAYRTIAEFAAEHRTWVHAGSMLERIPGEDKIYNTTVVFDASGLEVGRYRKIHLFDITTPSGRVYGESDTVRPGSGLLVYEHCGLRIGCAICYDLRFSNLFWELARRRVDVVILPAAFTVETGRDHWDVLCRSRAIEFQTYFVACGQWGAYPSADGTPRSCFGNSLVCDPWGQVITRASDGPGCIFTDLEIAEIERVRNLIPMASHRQVLSSCGGCHRAETSLLSPS